MSGPTKTDDQRFSSLAVWLIVAAVLLPVVYVLSVGPVVWLFRQGSWPADILYIIYSPIVFVADHWETARKSLDWYLNVWNP